jgi:hypothetical protein
VASCHQTFIIDTGSKLIPGIVDTGGKLTASILDTGGKLTTRQQIYGRYR